MFSLFCFVGLKKNTYVMTKNSEYFFSCDFIHYVSPPTEVHGPAFLQWNDMHMYSPIRILNWHGPVHKVAGGTHGSFVVQLCWRHHCRHSHEMNIRKTTPLAVWISISFRLTGKWMMWYRYNHVENSIPSKFQDYGYYRYYQKWFVFIRLEMANGQQVGL